MEIKEMLRHRSEGSARAQNCADLEGVPLNVVSAIRELRFARLGEMAELAALTLVVRAVATNPTGGGGSLYAAAKIELDHALSDAALPETHGRDILALVAALVPHT